MQKVRGAPFEWMIHRLNPPLTSSLSTAHCAVGFDSTIT